jgi:endonuclease-3
LTARTRTRKAGDDGPADAAGARPAVPATATRPRAKKTARRRSRYTRKEAEAIFARLAEALPEPKSELAYTNPFTLLVAVVLSAQATDAGVNRATEALFGKADTPGGMLALGEDAVREHIKTIGLYRNKAKNVIALSRALVEEHGGAVPRDRAALEALPGVGRKTANVVLNVAFGEETIAVDTHIFRLANRIGLAPGRTPDEVEAGLRRIVPKPYRANAHHWLILHGRHVCKARRPLCESCVIHDLCKSPEKRPRAPGDGGAEGGAEGAAEGAA